MNFRNFGGIHQMVVVDEDDLARIDSLDPARWAATSAPLAGLLCDPGFLQAIDRKGTGRVRVAQLVEARDWLFERLENRARLRERSDVLHLGDLRVTEESGRLLHQAAEHVLAQLGQADRTQLALADLRAFRASYRQLLANGDGVVCPSMLPEPEVEKLAADVMAVVGGVPEASGADGVGRPQLDRFLQGAREYLAWRDAATASPDVLPWGVDTEAAAALVEALDEKLEGYFWQCDLLREARMADAFQPELEEVKALRSQKAAAIERYLQDSPLAQPSADGALALDAAVNAAYLDGFVALREQVIVRALGEGTTRLTRASWRKIKALFAPYVAWRAQKPKEPFESLPAEVLAAYLDGPLPEQLAGYIEIDLSAAEELEQLGRLERLILFQRWLLELANNFVNFSALYDPAGTALVKAGSLVLDGRRLDFCTRVADRAAHRAVAKESLLYLVYAAVSERDGAPPAYEVVAPVTSGERGRLRVGKRGLFIDVAGREWDAVVVDIVENPISIAEAVRAPFRRISQFVTRKVEELAASQLDAREQAAQGTLGAGVESAGGALVADAPKKDGLSMRDLVLGGGIAFAALGSALAVTVSSLSKVRPLPALLALLGVVFAVGGLSALLGWLKLRRRDMALLLEASGWAVNIRMGLTRRLGLFFTRVPALPKEVRLDRADALEASLGEEVARERRVRRRLVAAGVGAALIAALAGLGLYARHKAVPPPDAEGPATITADVPPAAP